MSSIVKVLVQLTALMSFFAQQKLTCLAQAPQGPLTRSLPPTKIMTIAPIETNSFYASDQNFSVAKQYQCSSFITGLNNDSLPICAVNGQRLTSVDLSSVITTAAKVKIESTGLTTYSCGDGFISNYRVNKTTDQINSVSCIKSPDGPMVGDHPGFNVIIPGQSCPSIWYGEVQNSSASAVSQLLVNSTTGAIAYAMCEVPPTPKRTYTDYDCSGRGLMTVISNQTSPYFECNGMDMNQLTYEYGSKVIQSRSQDLDGQSPIHALFCPGGLISSVSLSSIGNYSQATCIGSEQNSLLVKDSYKSSVASVSLMSCTAQDTYDSGDGKFWAISKIFINETGSAVGALCAEIDPQKIAFPPIGDLPDVSGPMPELPADSKQVNYGRTLSTNLFNKDLKDIEDINQGTWGSCWFLAGMAAVAYRCPAAFTVKRKDNWTPRGMWSTCDVTLYDQQLQPKVYSKSCSGWYDHLSSPDIGWYPKWAGVFLTAAEEHFVQEGKHLKHGSYAEYGLRALIGQKFGSVKVNKINNLGQIATISVTASGTCTAVVASTYPDKALVKSVNLAPNHVYALLYQKDGMIVLSNPWGATNSPEVNVPGVQSIEGKTIFAIPESQFRRYFHSIQLACSYASPDLEISGCG
ncbi:hypothetical protein MIR68_001910 [Amoeboaphelidium protococcarum]|nr:hypothetical protein MIR68_001910 [Amoeboaphelidium protococcarum]